MMQGIRQISHLKDNIHSNNFQNKHKLGKNSFTRKRKLGFPMVFSTILKSVSRSLGIECEWLEPDVE